MTIKSVLFSHAMQCSMEEVHWYFRGYSVCCLLLASCWFLAWLTLLTLKAEAACPIERCWTSTRLYYITSQKIALFQIYYLNFFSYFFTMPVMQLLLSEIIFLILPLCFYLFLCKQKNDCISVRSWSCPSNVSHFQNRWIDFDGMWYSGSGRYQK
jgi:hypothetical protein